MEGAQRSGADWPRAPPRRPLACARLFSVTGTLFLEAVALVREEDSYFEAHFSCTPQGEVMEFSVGSRWSARS